MAENDPAGSNRDYSKRKINILDGYAANNNPPVT